MQEREGWMWLGRQRLGGQSSGQSERPRALAQSPGGGPRPGHPGQGETSPGLP